MKTKSSNQIFKNISDIKPESILEIIKLYKFSKNKDIAEKFKCTRELVARIGKVYNLNKDENFLAEMRKRVLTERNKRAGRDITPEFVKKEAKKYQTKKEFCFYDPSCYSYANKMGIMEEVSSHMLNCNFSVPQIILKQITQDIFKQKASYNNRKVIKPYEIDVYFPNLKLAFEYDGKGWHQCAEVDKKAMCSEKGITLITIKERSRNYLDDIKNQLVENIDIIAEFINSKTPLEDVIFYNKKINLPKIFTDQELKLCRTLSKSYLKANHKSLLERYYRYNPDDIEFTNKKWTEDKVTKLLSFYKDKKSFREENYGCYQAIMKRMRHLKKYYNKLQ